MSRYLAGLGVVIALVGCMSESPRSARGEAQCVISGCSDEVCADQPEFSPCIWRAAYVCYRDAVCAPQPDGACGWTPTQELTSCLASHSE